jgi:hypothetical protein
MNVLANQPDYYILVYVSREIQFIGKYSTNLTIILLYLVYVSREVQFIGKYSTSLTIILLYLVYVSSTAGYRPHTRTGTNQNAAFCRWTALPYNKILNRNTSI